MIKTSEKSLEQNSAWNSLHWLAHPVFCWCGPGGAIRWDWDCVFVNVVQLDTTVWQSVTPMALGGSLNCPLHEKDWKKKNHQWTLLESWLSIPGRRGHQYRFCAEPRLLVSGIKHHPVLTQNTRACGTRIQTQDLLPRAIPPYHLTYTSLLMGREMIFLWSNS